MQIQQYFKLLQGGWWIIVAMILVFTGMGIVFSYSQTPIYETNASFVVNPTMGIAETDDLLYSLDTLAGRTSLATTYSAMLESRANIETAATSLGIPFEMLADYDINAVVLPDSNVILLQIKGSSPELAADLANAIGTASVEYIGGLQAIYELRRVDLAIVEPDPISPNHPIDIALAAIVGMAGGMGFVVLRQILAQATKGDQGMPDPVQAFNSPAGIDNQNSHGESKVGTKPRKHIQPLPTDSPTDPIPGVTNPEIPGEFVFSEPDQSARNRQPASDAFPPSSQPASTIHRTDVDQFVASKNPQRKPSQPLWTDFKGSFPDKSTYNDSTSVNPSSESFDHRMQGDKTTHANVYSTPIPNREMDIQSQRPYNDDMDDVVEVIDMQKNERRHLAKQLFGPVQSIGGLLLQVELCEQLFDSDPVRAKSELLKLRKSAAATFQNTRKFVLELHPTMLEDLGPYPTLRKWIKDYELSTGISCELILTNSSKKQLLPPHIEIAILKVIHHLLDKIRNRTQTTHIQISVDIEDREVIVSVKDNSNGLVDPADTRTMDHQDNVVDWSVQEQVNRMGGEIELETEIRVSFPIEN